MQILVSKQMTVVDSGRLVFLNAEKLEQTRNRAGSEFPALGSGVTLDASSAKSSRIS